MSLMLKQMSEVFIIPSLATIQPYFGKFYPSVSVYIWVEHGGGVWRLIKEKHIWGPISTDSRKRTILTEHAWQNPCVYFKTFRCKTKCWSTNVDPTVHRVVYSLPHHGRRSCVYNMLFPNNAMCHQHFRKFFFLLWARHEAASSRLLFHLDFPSMEAGCHVGGSGVPNKRTSLIPLVKLTLEH